MTESIKQRQNHTSSRIESHSGRQYMIDGHLDHEVRMRMLHVDSRRRRSTGHSKRVRDGVDRYIERLIKANCWTWTPGGRLSIPVPVPGQMAGTIVTALYRVQRSGHCRESIWVRRLLYFWRSAAIRWEEHAKPFRQDVPVLTRTVPWMAR